MSKELISKKTRSEFREHFVSWTIREIEREFDAADVPCDTDYVSQTSSARRAQVDKYYHALDFTKWADVQKLLKVYEVALVQLEQTATHPDIYEEPRARAAITLAGLTKWLLRDGFEYKGGRITRTSGNVHLAEFIESAAQLNAPELQRQLDRLRAAVDVDPPLAIGTAKEIIETVCKTILHERNVTFDENADIPGLVKLTRKELGLLPEDIPDSARGVQTVRVLLSNLGTIAQGLGELRNLYGTGHGRSGRTRGLGARHARLAVGAASTLAMFLLETHAERGNGGGS